MEHTYIAVIGPLSFILINTISYKKHLFPAMEDDVPRDNLGTIYFPISLCVLVLLCFSGYLPLAAGAVGILIMGYGDGFAALAGTHYGRTQIKIGPWNTRKTILGSATMLAASFIVTMLVLLLSKAETIIATRSIAHIFSSGPPLGPSLEPSLGSSIVAGEAPLAAGGGIQLSLHLGTISLIAIVVSLGATIIELVTPRGLDNITVPILSAFLFSAAVV
jgi:phytol kinase